jgi:hypothetical protein
MFAFLLVALLVTLGVALAGWFRHVPAKSPTPTAYTDQQVAEARGKVCAEYLKVHNAIKASTSRDMGSDPMAQQVYALTGRQALLAGSEYLRTVLSAQPATPNELATATRKLTDLFPELTVDYLNSTPDSEMEPTVHAADEATLTVERLCK